MKYKIIEARYPQELYTKDVKTSFYVVLHGVENI